MNSVPESNNFPPSFFRVSVKGLVVVDGKVMLIDEGPKPSGGRWELPGGGLDFGEEIHQGLKREIEEELGLKVKTVSEKPMYLWTWHFENKRGMDWFYSLVLAYKIELENFDIDPTKEYQHVEFFSKEELEKIELRHQTNGLKKFFDPKDFE